MVIWSLPAKIDLRSIHDFIANDSRHYAKKVNQDIREKNRDTEPATAAGKNGARSKRRDG